VGCLVNVGVTATYRPITPVIGDIVGDIDLTASSQAIVEFPCPQPDEPSIATAGLCPKQP
jgi:hypothetical protein